MYKFLLPAVVFVLLAGPVAAQDAHVNGYTKSNGVYVQPYQRTAPDNNFQNNYSTKPNTNPYTGREGTRVTPPLQPNGNNFSAPGTRAPGQF